ncbi:hypothetical protein ABZ772_19670 [Streptomyces griseoincarnatus]
MTETAEPHHRLARHIEHRISELGLEYAEVARHAEFSIEVLRKMRHGTKARGSTYRKLERALQWDQGSVAAILAGREPIPLERTESRPAPVKAERPTLEQEMALAQRLLAATIREMNLSPEEADEVWRRVRLEIEATHRSHEPNSDRNGQNRNVI